MIEEIKPNLFVFYSPNSGSNAYILVGRKIALVDASSQGNTGDLGSALASIGLAPDQVDLVLFTHGHADHFSGAEAFGRAKLRMHKLDADYVNNKDEMFTAANILGSSHFPKIGSFLEPGKTIDFEPFSLEVIHTPGHTQGSVCFFDRAQKMLFSGDLLFKGSVGRWDLPSGNKEQLLNSINAVKRLDFEMLFPGHGLILREQQRENIESVLKQLSARFI